MSAANASTRHLVTLPFLCRAFAKSAFRSLMPLGTFRRIWISGAHAINFFEFSRNPLDFRSRDIREFLQRDDFLAA